MRADQAARRPLTLDDAEAVHATWRASEAADGVPMATPLDEVRRELREEGLDLGADSEGLFLPDGTCVAFGWAHLSPSPAKEGRWATLSGHVHPAHRGRGTGGALLDRLIARAEAQLAGLPAEPPPTLRAFHHDSQPTVAALLDARGFRATRWFDELTRDVRDTLPATPDRTAGVVVADWDDRRSDEVRGVRNAAFADHWGSVPVTPQTWLHHTADNEHFRPDLSVLAVVDGRVVGFTSTHVYEDDWPVVGRQEAWVQTVGVVRQARGRGVAAALLTAVLHRVAAAGMTHASLAVDSDSPTGAHRLYQRLGFIRSGRTVTRTRPAAG